MQVKKKKKKPKDTYSHSSSEWFATPRPSYSLISHRSLQSRPEVVVIALQKSNPKVTGIQIVPKSIVNRPRYMYTFRNMP